MRMIRRTIAAAVLAGSVAMIPASANAVTSPTSIDRECVRSITLAARYEDMAEDARQNGDLAAALRYSLAREALLRWIAANCIEPPDTDLTPLEKLDPSERPSFEDPSVDDDTLELNL